jgi:biopolymer transport protein TolR
MLPWKSENNSMSMTSGSRHGAEINVTPLIDVLLVLLIIFMVIVPPRNLGEKADIPLPQKTDTSQPEPQETLVLQLHDAGEGKQAALKINQQDVSWDKLEGRLRAIFQARSDKVAFLKGDSEVEFQYIAQAIDVAHHAGAERVGLLGPK